MPPLLPSWLARCVTKATDTWSALPRRRWRGSLWAFNRSPISRGGLALANIRPGRDLHLACEIGLAALLQPCLDLLQVPNHASRCEIEATREVASLFHFVDRAVGKWHNEPEFMPPDRSRQPGQHGGRAGVSRRVFVVVILISIIRTRTRFGFLIMSILPWWEEL